MIDFAHEEVLLLLALLAFGNVLNRPAEAHGPALRPGALKISKSITLRPADRAVSPPNPELMGVRLRIGGIERSPAVRREPCCVVGMHPFHEILDRYFIRSHIENFLKARIPRANTAKRIVLPPPEPGCIESELQTVFARLQVVLRRLSPGGSPAKLRHQGVDLGDRGFDRRQRTALSQSGRGARCVADRTCDNPAQP